MQQGQLLQDYDQAVARERSVWAKARGKHVGGEDYDKAVWDQRVQAAARVPKA